MTPPQPHQKTLVQKTSHDMQLSLVAFQKAQKVSAERQRTVVEDTKRDLDYETNAVPEEYVTLSNISSLSIHPLRSPQIGSSQRQQHQQQLIQQYVRLSISLSASPLAFY